MPSTFEVMIEEIRL